MATKWKCYKQNFRDTWMRTLKSNTNLQITDTAISGLFLRYSAATNDISFYLACKIKSTEIRRNIMIGKYGDFTIPEVRERAVELRRMIGQGQYPVYEMQLKRKREIEERAKQIKIKDLLKDYLEKYSKLYKKPSTQKSDESLVRLYINPAVGDLPITGLELPIIQDLYNDTAKKTSFTSANHVAALMSHFWNWCEDYKYLPHGSNIWRKVRKGQNPKFEVRVLDLDEYKRLLASIEAAFRDSHFNPRALRALKVLVLTGCRYSEITKLRKDEVDLSQGVLRLKDSKVGPRNVSLGEPAIEELRKALDANEQPENPYVFPAVYGDGALQDVRKPFAWVLKHAGLPHMRVHDLRHSFISMGANMGTNLNALKEVVGHTQITTTEGYTHIAENKKRETANQIAEMIAG